ncbi:MAG: CinA family protein [Pseudobdellovibrionaceae bacterium]
MQKQASDLSEILREKGLSLVTAESCTGGMIAAAMTDLAGSSEVFERGFITYSNASKTSLLDVPTVTIAQHGAVSSAAAEAMALGALGNSAADVAVSVTGIAGPGGGTKDKPVGLVWFGFAGRTLNESPVSKHMIFDGDRGQIREQAVAFALQSLIDLLS